MRIKQDNAGGLEGFPPFQRAVVAVALSPHLPAVLNQSSHLLRPLGTEVLLLHVGGDSAAARRRLEEAIAASAFGRDQTPALIIQPGQPVEVIAAVARRERADLIIAGAPKKESLLRHFLGSVATQLASGAPCSLLLMTDSSLTPTPIFRIHCAVEYDRPAHFAVEVAISIARQMHSRELVLTHSFHIPEWEGKMSKVDTKETQRIYHRQDLRLRRFLSRFPSQGVSCRAQCFHEHSLSATLEFARDLNANLLVLPGPRRQSGVWDRLIKNNLTHLLQTLPDAILVTRKPRYSVRRSGDQSGAKKKPVSAIGKRA
ncbi:MAG TPA: universal stress protein [bacterium]|nr:universal stress protein [bacterium]HQI48856.1 universal stress protein [bacterium]HQJ65400.1 universal stress protein [bacterium]